MFGQQLTDVTWSLTGSIKRQETDLISWQYINNNNTTYYESRCTEETCKIYLILLLQLLRTNCYGLFYLELVQWLQVNIMNYLNLRLSFSLVLSYYGMAWQGMA